MYYTCGRVCDCACMTAQEVADQRGTARTPIFVSGADCSGSEATLTMCPGVNLGSSLSSGEGTHDSDVNLVCFNSAGPGAGTGACLKRPACVINT